MQEQKKAVAQQPKGEQPQPTGNIFLFRPRVTPFKTFHYRGMEDLKSLIVFVGKSPQLQIGATGEPELVFKKTVVKNNTYLVVNSFGEIITQYTENEVKEKFDLIAQRPLTAEDINKVVEKQRKPREKKA